jgi:hypothetical protein
MLVVTFRRQAVPTLLACCLAAPLVAGNLCNLPPQSCNPASCAGGCSATAPLAHPNVDPCVSGGGIDFSATAYASTCQSGAGCPVDVPPLRFWQHGDYRAANSGCQDAEASQWLSNAELDYGIAGAPGVWLLDQANFQGPQVDGCIDRAQAAVVELTWLDAPTEGTVDHGAWYLVAAAEFDPAFGAYNFDRIVGCGGCNAATIEPRLVPSPTLAARTEPCTGAPATVTRYQVVNAADRAYFDVVVVPGEPAPPEYRTAALAGTPLIAGYQVLYREGSEPTSSDPAGWLPARDPAAPATDAAPLIPVGAASATVAIPLGQPTMRYYVALRIVYVDTGLNPTTSWPLSGDGPRVTSLVSGHCGPFHYSPVLAVEFGELSARRTARGNVIEWTTLDEQDTLGFQVSRASRKEASSAELVPGFVVAHGPFLTYRLTDAAAAGEARTWHYFVQEVTSSGVAGDRSPWVTVGGAEPGRGRARGRAGRDR